MKSKFSIFVAFIFFAIAGCKKPITKPNSGIYRGTFFQIFESGDTNAQGVVNIALSADGNAGTYTVSGDTSTGAPFSHYGNYLIDNTTDITFTNKATGLILTYQPHYILDTTYEYTFDDHDFTLDLVTDTIRYEYKLIRD